MLSAARGPRRFAVSAARIKMKWVGLLMLVWMLALVGLMSAVALLLPREIVHAAVGGCIALSVVAYGAFLVYALTPKEVPIDLWPDRLIIDEGRGGVFPLSDALLGAWTVPSYGVAAGTALHLRYGEQRFCLGGRDHRPSPALRLGAPAVESVDAYMPAADFDALLAALGSGPGPAFAPAEAAAPAVIRCSLTPNRASGKGAMAMMLPWILTMVVIGVVSGVSGALGLFDSAVGQLAITTLAVVLIVVGIVATMIRSMRRPQPVLEIELDAHDLRVIDLASRRVVAAAPLSHVMCERCRHTYTGRSSFTMVVLLVQVPGMPHAITIGIPDLRFSWAGPSHDKGAAAYVVGGPDWFTLVDRLGARPYLQVARG